MIPMWSVSVPAGEPDHPWLANGRYRHFSGAGAANRARAFADRHGLRLAEGMGDRRGWLATEAYLAELGRLVTITDQEIWDGLRAGAIAPVTARAALLYSAASTIDAAALRARAHCMQDLQQHAASIGAGGMP
jgi:hypothetical protein